MSWKPSGFAAFCPTNRVEAFELPSNHAIAPTDSGSLLPLL
jgi:hypothetical protein